VCGIRWSTIGPRFGTVTSPRLSLSVVPGLTGGVVSPFSRPNEVTTGDVAGPSGGGDELTPSDRGGGGGGGGGGAERDEVMAAEIEELKATIEQLQMELSMGASASVRVGSHSVSCRLHLHCCPRFCLSVRRSRMHGRVCTRRVVAVLCTVALHERCTALLRYVAVRVA
jgi:hypothetical protein